MKFARNVLHVNTHQLTVWIFDLTSLFQDGAMRSFHTESAATW